jgi:hypothetical protein
MRPELIEEAIQRECERGPIAIESVSVRERIEAVEALAAVAKEASEQIQADKTARLEKLKDQQARLVRPPR